MSISNETVKFQGNLYWLKYSEYRGEYRALFIPKNETGEPFYEPQVWESALESTSAVDRLLADLNVIRNFEG